MTYWQRTVLYVCPCFFSSGPPFWSLRNGGEEVKRRGWFFEKWGLETNNPSQKERPAASVYHAQVNCDGNVSSNEAETGKRGTFENKRGWYMGKSRQSESTFLLVF